MPQYLNKPNPNYLSKNHSVRTDIYQRSFVYESSLSKNFGESLRTPSSSLGSSTHTSRGRHRAARKNVGAESASTSSRASPSTSGAGSLQRQHSKEHSRVIKRGKWSPGGEARLFEAVSSKGNLAMTSAEPKLHSTATEGTSDRERPKKRGQRRDYIIQP